MNLVIVDQYVSRSAAPSPPLRIRVKDARADTRHGRSADSSTMTSRASATPVTIDSSHEIRPATEAGDGWTQCCQCSMICGRQAINWTGPSTSLQHSGRTAASADASLVGHLISQSSLVQSKHL